MFTWDVDGWYSGDNPDDADAGRVTSVDPQAVNGGPGKRWNGTEWTTQFPNSVEVEESENVEDGVV